MSEVGTPPPHNSYKPHGMVDSINNKQQQCLNIKSIILEFKCIHTIVNHGVRNLFIACLVPLYVSLW